MLTSGERGKLQGTQSLFLWFQRLIWVVIIISIGLTFGLLADRDVMGWLPGLGAAAVLFLSCLTFCKSVSWEENKMDKIRKTIIQRLVPQNMPQNNPLFSRQTGQGIQGLKFGTQSQPITTTWNDPQKAPELPDNPVPFEFTAKPIGTKIKCPICGSEWPKGISICGNCGNAM